MKQAALRKDILREIRKSMGRFLSIFAIVAIGVAFFAGVKASVPIMKGSADAYFDDYNLMDLKLMSTIGLVEEDVAAIQQVEGVEGVYAGYSLDALQIVDKNQKVLKVMSFPMGETTSKNYINQMRLIEGRLPEKENECVIEHVGIKGNASRINDTITLSSGTQDKLSDSLKNTTYTVVGEVTTPYYLSYEKGSSAIGSGSIDNYIIIPESNFKLQAYTEVYVTIQGAKELNSYDDAYFDVVDKVKASISAIGEERADLRFSDIKKDAMKKVTKGRKEYDANLKKYEEEIKKGEKQLKDGHDELIIGQATLNANQSSTSLLLNQKETELKQNETMLRGLLNQYDLMKEHIQTLGKQMDDKDQEVQQQLKESKEKLKDLDKQIKEVEEQLRNPEISERERQLLEDKKAALEFAKQYASSGLDLMQQQLTVLKETIDTAKAQLQGLDMQVKAIRTQISDGKKQIAAAKAQADEEFQKAQQQLQEGTKALSAGEIELEKQKQDGSAKLAEAKEKLDKAESDITSMETPQWYVLDRHSHYSYMDYGSAADRMGGIAKVFPLFFFLVAALVCLTTMTRMVDEQRQEIGTLKALGYTKGAIAMKYVAYAGIASIFGGIFGSVIGMAVFPSVIYNAWNIMYTLPPVRLQFQLGLALISIGIVSFITIAAAFAAVYKELMEVPSQLMRPKAPKNGKKILLERVPWIWKRFNFIHKVTARNIFRYKKRFFMTVIGISGCTALLVAGFGIQDSIGEIAILQYEELHQYDVSMNFDKDAKASQREEALQSLRQHKDIQEAMGISIVHGFYEEKGEDKGIDLYIPMDMDAFPDFVALRTRVGHDPLTLSNDGAIISEKLAKEKGLQIGDTFAVDNGDGTKKDVKINGITENYVGHSLFMTPTYYKSTYHLSPKTTTLLGIMKTTDKNAETDIGNAFMEEAGIESVTFYSGIAENFKDTISSLSFIVIVLIISAGMLAFVVLYNLTNVNISERLREIATIKVLGFYDNEVSAYVYRENIVLTLIGALVGLVLGIGLHAMIMSLAELDTVMFGRNIYGISYVYSVLITMAFSVIVNLVMYRKLKKIPMVESLKSVE